MITSHGCQQIDNNSRGWRNRTILIIIIRIIRIIRIILIIIIRIIRIILIIIGKTKPRQRYDK